MPTNPDIKFRKKTYDSLTDNVDGVLTFDSDSKRIYLDGDAYGNVQADWNQTIGTEPDFIKNKPTIGSAALTVKRNGITLVSFSANSSSPETVDINVPSVGYLNTNNSSALSVNSNESLSGTVSLHRISKTGAYSDLSGTPVLSDVALSGDYSDLSGTPTIGNALLTISRNSVVLGTFSADATTDKLVNISVPTTAADVNAMPSSTKYGDSILLSMNGATDTLTATLKDQDGNTLGTSTAVITGKITDITYTTSTKSLLISKSDSSTIGLNFQDAPSSTAPNSLLSGLRDDVNSNAGAIAVLNGSGSGSVSSTVSAAISNLNAQVTTASKTNDIVSIKSTLTESDGIISNSSSSTIDLAKVAATGSSGDVTVSYGGSQQNNVQSAITDLDSRVTSLSGNQIEYILPNSAATTPSGYSHYYSGSSYYTGTLAASASTMNKIYVCRTTQGGDYHQIMTVKNGSSYSWIDMSTQSIDLTGYAKSVTVNGNAYTTSGSGTDINVGNVITAVTGENAVSGGVQDYVSVTATTTGGSGGSRTTSLVSRVKTQAVATAAQNQDGLATANDVRGYVQDNQTIIRTWTVSDIPTA